MIKWLVTVIFGWPWCAHKWEIIERINVFERDASRRPCETLFALQCQKCGDIKRRKVSA